MSVHHCCEIVTNSARRETITAPHTQSDSPPPTFARRCLGFAGWLIPGAVLTLLPKCPACLAAYVTFGASIGLSLSTATYLRMLLLILCTTSLAYFAARRLRRFGALILSTQGTAQ